MWDDEHRHQQQHQSGKTFSLVEMKFRRDKNRPLHPYACLSCNLLHPIGIIPQGLLTKRQEVVRVKIINTGEWGEGIESRQWTVLYATYTAVQTTTESTHLKRCCFCDQTHPTNRLYSRVAALKRELMDGTLRMTKKGFLSLRFICVQYFLIQYPVRALSLLRLSD